MDIFVRIFNPLLMVIFGLAAGILVARLKDVEWKLYGIGALTFIGSQILHIPFNLWALNPMLENMTAQPLGDEGIKILTALALGASAGIFEESFRLLTYQFWIKDSRRWKDALMLGAGHGGIEAIILGIITFLSVLQIHSLSGQDLSLVIPQDQLPLAEAQISAFWALPWYGVLLGAGERVFALCFHLAASVLVVQVFRRRNKAWLVAAIGLHTGLNAFAVYGALSWGPYLTELALGLYAIFCLWIIFHFRNEEHSSDDQLAVEPAPLVEIRRIELTKEQLEESKYE